MELYSFKMSSTFRLDLRRQDGAVLQVDELHSDILDSSVSEVVHEKMLLAGTDYSHVLFI